jgi:hypothetical protein
MNITENSIVSSVLQLTDNLEDSSSPYRTDRRQPLRDKQKELVSQEAGITLIVIPYWWRHSEAFVLSETIKRRPDLRP